jgi:hypothetical protein
VTPEAHLNLTALGVKPDDQALVLKWEYDDIENKSTELRLEFKADRDPPPPPTIDRVIFRIHTTNENKEVNGRIKLYLLDPGGKALLERGYFGERDDWKNGDNRAFGLPDAEGKDFAQIPAPSGAQFTARIRLENFFVNGLFNDAVKWNCTWEVLLQHWNGSSYDVLGTYSGSREFKADGTDVGDIAITIK